MAVTVLARINHRLVSFEGAAAAALLAIVDAGRSGFSHEETPEWVGVIADLRAASVNAISVQLAPDEDPRWLIRGRVDLLNVERS